MHTAMRQRFGLGLRRPFYQSASEGQMNIVDAIPRIATACLFLAAQSGWLKNIRYKSQ